MTIVKLIINAGAFKKIPGYCITREDKTIAELLISLFVFFTAKYIHVCKANDPDIANCIIQSVDGIREHLKDGIPELDVPPLEPLLLDEIKLRRGPQSAQIDANITDIEVWGPTTFKILELK